MSRGGRGALASARPAPLQLAVLEAGKVVPPRAGKGGFAGERGQDPNIARPPVLRSKGARSRHGRGGERGPRLGANRVPPSCRSWWRGWLCRRGRLFDCCVFSTPLSLFFFSDCFFFPWSTTTGGAGRDGTDAGSDSNAGRHGGAGGPDGYVSFSFFVLSTFLFSSSYSSSFPVVSFSVEYDNRRCGTGRDRRRRR